MQTLRLRVPRRQVLQTAEALRCPRWRLSFRLGRDMIVWVDGVQAFRRRSDCGYMPCDENVWRSSSRFLGLVALYQDVRPSSFAISSALAVLELFGSLARNQTECALDGGDFAVVSSLVCVDDRICSRVGEDVDFIVGDFRDVAWAEESDFFVWSHARVVECDGHELAPDWWTDGVRECGVHGEVIWAWKSLREALHFDGPREHDCE